MILLSGCFALPLVTSLLSCGSQPSQTASLDLVGVSHEDIKARFYSSDYLDYLGYSFFSHDGNNVVVQYSDSGRVSRFYEIGDAALNEESTDLVAIGDDIVTAVSKMGLPSFEGVQKENSLDFAKSEKLICRLTFDENDGELSVKSKAILDKEDPSSWFDEDKTRLPDIAIAQSIVPGMSLDDVVAAMGKPQRDVGSGPLIMEFDLSDGGKVDITMYNNSEKENAYQEERATRVYGTHYLYVFSIRFVA